MQKKCKNEWPFDCYTNIQAYMLPFFGPAAEKATSVIKKKSHQIEIQTEAGLQNEQQLPAILL